MMVVVNKFCEMEERECRRKSIVWFISFVFLFIVSNLMVWLYKKEEGSWCCRNLDIMIK